MYPPNMGIPIQNLPTIQDTIRVVMVVLIKVGTTRILVLITIIEVASTKM